MSIVQNINLNLIPNSAPIIVHCDQYDVGENRIVASLYKGDVAYTPSAGATARIQGTKPDGHGFMYDATISGNTVTADLTNQMSVVAGRVCCQIVVTESDNRTGSFVFFLEVQKSALPDDTEMSASDYQVIEELLETAQAINENFPYIGANGHWYYYDVEQGEYVDSGASAGTSVSVGTTTTLPQGEDATVTNSGDNVNAIFNFGIPRGPKGDDGEPGQDGADGVTPDISMSATADAVSSATPTVDIVKTGSDEAPNFALAFHGLKGQQGEQGIQGETGATGATGNGIVSITKTGTSGLVDTYTITYTNGTTSTFTVTNGQDGTGSGDMTKSVYDSTNAVANAGGIVSYINGLNFGKYLALYGATALSASDLNDVVNLGTYYKSGSGLKSHSPSDIVAADEYTLIVMGAMASSVATDGDPVIQLMVAHIAATDEAKIYLRGFIGTTGSFVDPFAWTSWVCLNAPDVSGKADKVSGATNGDLAGLDANGNLTDSGISASDITAIEGKIPSSASSSNKMATASDITNAFEVMGQNGAKNLVENKATSQTTASGVVFTVLSDKKIQAVVSSTLLTYTNVVINSNIMENLKPDVPYILNGTTPKPTGASYRNWRLSVRRTSDNTIIASTEGNESTGVTFTITSDMTSDTYFLEIGIFENTTAQTIVFSPMIRLASDPDDTYQPHAMTNQELTEVKKITPTLTCTTNNATASWCKQTKIGKVVNIYFRIKVTSALSVGGNILFTATSDFIKPATNVSLLGYSGSSLMSGVIESGQQAIALRLFTNAIAENTYLNFSAVYIEE